MPEDTPEQAATITAINEPAGFVPEPDSAIAAPLPRNVWETDWSDETVTSQDFDVYKGRAKVTDRIGLLSKPLIARIHYKEGLGYIICNSEFKLQGSVEVCTRMAPCCEQLTEPRKRIVALIIKYDTKPDGALVQPFGYKLLVWKFSDDKFVQLRNINSEWPLTEHDLLANCSEEQYQKMTFSACRQAIHRSEAFQKAYGAQIDEWLKAVHGKLAKNAGRKFTDGELLEKLGAVTPATAVVKGMDTSPIADIAELLK